jgi:hypothetical protein
MIKTRLVYGEHNGRIQKTARVEVRQFIGERAKRATALRHFNIGRNADPRYTPRRMGHAGAAAQPPGLAAVTMTKLANLKN